MEEDSYFGAENQAESGTSSLPCKGVMYCDAKNGPSEPLESGEIIARGVRCRSHFCPECQIVEMADYRDALRPILRRWKRRLTLTVTVGRERFSDPVDAWRFVGEGRYLGRLMRKLAYRGLVDSKEWIRALEFHADQEGWPHWHIGVPASFIDKHLCQKLWGLGNVWISSGKKWQSSDHALNYLTKYLMKPAEGYPAWVMDSRLNIRRFETSRGLMPGKKRKRSEGVAVEPRRKSVVRETVEKCKSKTQVFLKIGGKYHYVATFDVCGRCIDETGDVIGKLRELQAFNHRAGRLELELRGDILAESFAAVCAIGGVPVRLLSEKFGLPVALRNADNGVSEIRLHGGDKDGVFQQQQVGEVVRIAGTRIGTTTSEVVEVDGQKGESRAA